MSVGCWNIRTRVVGIAGKYTDNRAKTHIKPGYNDANKRQEAEILGLQNNMGTGNTLESSTTGGPQSMMINSNENYVICAGWSH